MEQIPKIIHPSWYEDVMPLFNDDRMKFIKYNLLPNCQFLPEPNNIFKVFRMPKQEIKVVILGQDPYPTPGHANGLAFAVNEGIKMPVSLRIIREETMNSLGQYNVQIMTEKWPTLENWERQGIFLLNTALTVEKRNSGRHLKHWKWFTEEIIEIISRDVRPIWLLWGKKAQLYERIILKCPIEGNKVLKAPHPAAEAYAGRKAGFLGCDHFKKVNRILEQINRKIINF